MKFFIRIGELSPTGTTLPPSPYFHPNVAPPSLLTAIIPKVPRPYRRTTLEILSKSKGTTGYYRYYGNTGLPREDETEKTTYKF